MIRLVGALLILSASVTLGSAAAHMYRRRVWQLDAFYALISHIGAQIDGFLLPLDRIYADFHSRELEDCGFLALLREYGGERALALCRSLVLTGDELEELTKFFSGLGHHAADEELRHCAYFEKRIGAMVSQAREQLAKKGKLCRALGALFGILCTVILI